MDVLSVLLQQRTRKIGLIIPDVVITEKHSDTLEITEHPVEVPTAKSGGASAEGAGFIADHAFRRPSELTMEIGFSGGGSVLDLANTTGIGLAVGKSPREMYQQLLDLQRTRKPFDVVTGKRIYTNMLIRVLDVTTDRTSENVLMATVTLREIITSQTQTITSAAKTDMTQGVNTSAVQNTGVKTPKAVNQSMLSKISSLFTGA
ncbi:MAG: phage baseplate protein [Rouxiella badensis]|uniref:phage baseplate protein n=1 Tax=Rouxiella badensis TaxID=1646377 RepID=UPI001D156AF5|nr:hypothetical protein [Rouxiella badensis]MCC3717981.1 hypothetical protein [Rouxiella badensis]MCC3730004.1 hypothetical protein [Rouxiella badensis]